MTHNDDERKVINAAVCQPSHAALKGLCRRHGVTMAGFLDALGHMLAEHATLSPVQLQKANPRLLAALEQARQIDVDRRYRD